MGEQVCPVCGRSIVVEHGRWTRHTDPTNWRLGRAEGVRNELKQCFMAEKPVSQPADRTRT